VHTSMARGIQPFSTYDDGDTLFAASTQEVGDAGSRPTIGAIDFIAAEAMWDAILASVPREPAPDTRPDITVSPAKLAGLVGRYRAGPNAVLEIGMDSAGLNTRLVGRPFFDLRAEPAALHALSETEYRVESRYGTRLAFTLGPDGKATALTVNPGRWAQQGERLGD